MKPNYKFTAQTSARDVTWVGETFQAEVERRAQRKHSHEEHDWFLSEVGGEAGQD